MRKLEGGCQVPIGAYARIEGDKLVMDGLVGSVEGDVIVREYLEGSVDDPIELGERMVVSLREMGAGEILAAVRAAAEADGVDGLLKT